MSFDKLVEEIIKSAIERGEFDNLPGTGKPIDLTAYFDAPNFMVAAFLPLSIFVKPKTKSAPRKAASKTKVRSKATTRRKGKR